ncbi:hypothetical protein MJ390_17940 [Klebsiella pneumoniae]|nr:hypothetical protein MJ390_17940 [Klebsiella pneumoniae]
MNKTDELRTARIESLVTPAELAQRHPVTADVAAHVSASRRRIEKILNGEDRRLLVIIGPCSIPRHRRGAGVCPPPPGHARSDTSRNWRS